MTDIKPEVSPHNYPELTNQFEPKDTETDEQYVTRITAMMTNPTERILFETSFHFMRFYKHLDELARNPEQISIYPYNQFLRLEEAPTDQRLPTVTMHPEYKRESIRIVNLALYRVGLLIKESTKQSEQIAEAVIKGQKGSAVERLLMRAQYAITSKVFLPEIYERMYKPQLEFMVRRNFEHFQERMFRIGLSAYVDKVTEYLRLIEGPVPIPELRRSTSSLEFGISRSTFAQARGIREEPYHHLKTLVMLGPKQLRTYGL